MAEDFHVEQACFSDLRREVVAKSMELAYQSDLVVAVLAFRNPTEFRASIDAVPHFLIEEEFHSGACAICRATRTSISPR